MKFDENINSWEGDVKGGGSCCSDFVEKFKKSISSEKDGALLLVLVMIEVIHVETLIEEIVVQAWDHE